MITAQESGTAFLLRRAEEEAIRAIATGPSEAASAHFQMSVLYSARAREALIGRAPPSDLDLVTIGCS